jgi:hypothetical protein
MLISSVATADPGELGRLPSVLLDNFLSASEAMKAEEYKCYQRKTNGESLQEPTWSADSAAVHGLHRRCRPFYLLFKAGIFFLL